MESRGLKAGLMDDKRGISFTLDAIMVIMISIAFLFVLYRMMSNAPQNSQQNILSQESSDVLAVLESSGYFRRLLAGDTDEFQMIVEWLMPDTKCGRITVYDKDCTELKMVNMTCWDSQEQKNVAYRTFIYEEEPYYAKMESWINE